MQEEPTHFANIDLELLDASPLDEFIAAWGDDVFVLYHGECEGGWRLAVEVGAMTPTAEATAQRFIELIRGLGPAGRARWNALKDRVFDLGVNAGVEPRMWNTSLSPETLGAISELAGRLVLTVYAAQEATLGSD